MSDMLYMLPLVVPPSVEWRWTSRVRDESSGNLIVGRRHLLLSHGTEKVGSTLVGYP